MNQRRDTHHQEPQPAATGFPTSALPTRDGKATMLMIVSELEAERSRWAQRTETIGGCPPVLVSEVSEAIDKATSSAIALALLSESHPERSDIIMSLRRLGVACVVITGQATLPMAMMALREGAVDLLGEQLSDEECAQRIIIAARRDAEQRGPSNELRLKGVCRTLNEARNDVTQQVGTMCDDLVEAYAELTREMAQVRLSSEFGAIIRQELDLEDLLRTVLEFMLAKVGSTNTAVYLPASAGEYSLSAYVNYDCPRESGELMMEHLADVVPAAIESRTDIVVLDTNEQLNEMLGEHGRWLEDYAAAAFSCLDEDGECLAVVFMFRDQHTGFDEASQSTLAAIAPVFAEQLSRIVRVHRRHLPMDDENMLFGDCDDTQTPPSSPPATDGPFGFDDDLDWDDEIDLAA